MSMPPDVKQRHAELKEAADKLSALLSAPEYGLISWWSALRNILRTIRQISSEVINE